MAAEYKRAKAPLGEVWQEITRLKKENDNLRTQVLRREDETDELLGNSDNKKSTPKMCFISRRRPIYVFLSMTSILSSLISVVLIVVFLANWQSPQSSEISSFLTPYSASDKLGRRILASSNSKSLSVGLRTDYLLQECQGSGFKRSFPDLDYSFFGYNILKGYPLANGHDPGFTYPIFRADYTKFKQTADCRYSVPDGLVVVPDVSCVTSFSSKIVQTRFELEKKLSVSANVGGGRFGVSFSASAGYKETSSTLSSGKTKFIYSSANCKYYFAKLEPTPPPLHEDFIKAVRALDTAEGNDIKPYFDFFTYYGTHFVTEVTYGARFTYEHKMSSKTFEEARSRGVNVAVQAGYSGAFNFGGGFSLDSSQLESAMNFQKSVETKTISVGAPPPGSGNAMSWASTAKQSPVPVEYKLEFIYGIFNQKYMGSLDIDFRKIAKRLQQAEMEYCEHMRKQGLVDSCHVVVAGLKLRNTRLEDYYSKIEASESTCLDYCSQQMNCVGISICHGCEEGKRKFCYLLSDDSGNHIRAYHDKAFDTVIIPLEIRPNSSLTLHDTKIKGNTIQRHFADNHFECSRKCRKEAYCVSFSYGVRLRSPNCLLFGEGGVAVGIEKRKGINTYIIN